MVLLESFTSKWWLSSKIEAWSFTKNKLEKLVNRVLFAGLILNIIIQKKSARKLHLLWMLH